MMQVIRGGRLERGEYLVTEHRAIVEGLEARDAAAARAAIARHVETGRRIALDAIERAGGSLCSPGDEGLDSISAREPASVDGPRAGRPGVGSPHGDHARPTRDRIGHRGEARLRAGRRDGARASRPGAFPFTRGPYPDMYRGRPWTMRQYAGFGSAEETNARFRTLLARGQTGLSVAFDLPTQLGYDSDDPVAEGEVGRTGVAIDSVEDMARLLRGDPARRGLDLDDDQRAGRAPAPLLRARRARSSGIPGDALRGTVQNDVLKEYVARGNYIFPPRPSMRLTTDLFAYCAERIPSWNTISISGYHIREAGSTAAQELAFTLANGIAYCEAAVAAGLSPDEFGARLSFFFNAHNDVLQEVAKFRAARRLWARIMRDRFGATSPKAQALRFHAQTGGSTLTAQQPENNLVRVAAQALSAVYGGAQSIHTNGFDEALALPTERAATLALRTQQILMHEAGTTDTADPLGGSWFVESLTDELERSRGELIERIDELGGAVAAIEAGWVQEQIEESAFRWQRDVESGERVDRRRQPVHDRRAGARRAPSPRPRDRARAARADAGAPRAPRRGCGRGGGRRGAPRRRDGREPAPGAARRARRPRTVGELCGALRELWGTYDAAERSDDTYPSPMSARGRVAAVALGACSWPSHRVVRSAPRASGATPAATSATPTSRVTSRRSSARPAPAATATAGSRRSRSAPSATSRAGPRSWSPRSKERRMPPWPPSARARRATSARRAGRWTRGSATTLRRLGALAARPAGLRAPGHACRAAACRSARRRARASRASSSRCASSYRPAGGEGRDRRLPLLPPRPEAARATRS